MTRSDLIDLAVREAIQRCHFRHDGGFCFRPFFSCRGCQRLIANSVKSEWPRLLSSHPITEES
jgi:hypothetical protein